MKRHLALGFLTLIVTAGCQQKMADQPSYRPLTKSTLFPGAKSARALPRGAIAREWMTSSNPLTSGLNPDYRVDSSNELITPPPGAPVDASRFVDRLPFEPTRADLQRGQERYTIYCALCHDPIGTGRGKIVERGFTRPPDFHTDQSRGFALYAKSISLKNVPLGYLFEVISHGFGSMPRYGPQIYERDRWCIVAYVRALQLSQHAIVSDLPETLRHKATAALGAKQ